MLHAVGFTHQQSASNRDEYVKINWENISEGHEHNFNKYDESKVTDYGTAYDYQSLMHYSGKAFSKNKKDTMEALKPFKTLGQRKGFTDTDLVKLNKMYAEPCHLTKTEEEPLNLESYEDVKTFFKQLSAFF